MIQTYFNYLAAIGAVCSMIGAWLVARGNVRGFAIFLFGEAFLAPVQVYTKTWPQVVLIAYFAGVNIYALIRAHNYAAKPEPRYCRICGVPGHYQKHNERLHRLKEYGSGY